MAMATIYVTEICNRCGKQYEGIRRNDDSSLYRICPDCEKKEEKEEKSKWLKEFRGGDLTLTIEKRIEKIEEMLYNLSRHRHFNPFVLH